MHIDALDRSRCLEILDGYGVGPRALSLLRQVLGETPDGGVGGGVLRRNLPWGERRDAGGPTAAHHIQCGGGRSGPPLGIIGGGNTWG